MVKQDVNQVCFQMLEPSTRHCSHSRTKTLFPLSVTMLLLQLPIVPKSPDWTKKQTRCLPLYSTLFDLSADLACPCGQRALLQERDIHRPSGRSCALQPIHSTRRNYIFQLSAAIWWKYIGGKRMCGETQSAQHRAHKHTIKVNFIEITFSKHNQKLLTFCARFWRFGKSGCVR